MYPDYNAGAAGKPTLVTAGRPALAAWWYLIPVGILLLGLLVSGVIALAPAESRRLATPIAEGQTVTFDMESGKRYWLFHDTDPPRRGRSCEFSGDATNGLRVGDSGPRLLSRPPKEVQHGGRAYRHMYGIVSDDDSSVSATCAGGALLVERAAPPRWIVLLPVALAAVVALSTAIVIGVHRRAPVVGLRSRHGGPTTSEAGGGG